MLKAVLHEDQVRRVEVPVQHHLDRKTVKEILALYFESGGADFAVKKDVYDVIRNAVWNYGAAISDVNDGVSKESSLKAEQALKTWIPEL